jgi:enoyl-CoA hydratase/carnithine racemase
MTTPLPLAPVPGFPGLHVLTLEANQGPMTVLDEALIQRLEAALKLVPPTCAGLILASGSPRVFVAGADLKQIQGLDVDALERYLAFGQRVFGMLCALPCPTVAAINGAALGGGLELAMHCDGLVAAPPPPKDGQPGRPYPIGLPEAGLCICPGWGGTNLLPARLAPLDAITRTATGQTMTIDQATSAGLIDRTAPSPEALIPTAAQWLMDHRAIAGARRDGNPLRWIGRSAYHARAVDALLQARTAVPASPAAKAVLDAVQAGLERGWPAALEVERRELNRLRSTDAGRDAIRAFFEKSAKK